MNEAKMNEVNDLIQGMWNAVANPDGSLYGLRYVAFCNAQEALLASKGIKLEEYFDWCSAKEGL